jgi:hypothetical protein
LDDCFANGGTLDEGSRLTVQRGEAADVPTRSPPFLFGRAIVL